MKKYITAIFMVLALLFTGACSSDADVASKNLSKDADNFKIYRQVVFYNGITGDYIAEVSGYCSIGNGETGRKVTITCKNNDGKYIKNYLGLSDNVTYFALQADGADVSTSRYKVVFKPSTIVPDVEVR